MSTNIVEPPKGARAITGENDRLPKQFAQNVGARLGNFAAMGEQEPLLRQPSPSLKLKDARRRVKRLFQGPPRALPGDEVLQS